MKDFTGGYTENIGYFGARELFLAAKLLKAAEKGYPWDFDYESNVKIAMNTNSGEVFLTNDEYQVAMAGDNGELYSFYTMPYSGVEGSAEDIALEFHEDPESWEEDDIEYLKDIVRGGVDAGEIDEDDEDIQFVLNYNESEETEEE